MAISNKKAVEAAKVIADYCKEQTSCQNCIFRLHGCENWHCAILLIPIRDFSSWLRCCSKHTATQTHRFMDNKGKFKPGTKFRGIINGDLFEVVKIEGKIATLKHCPTGETINYGLRALEKCDVTIVEVR